MCSYVAFVCVTSQSLISNKQNAVPSLVHDAVVCLKMNANWLVVNRLSRLHAAAVHWHGIKTSLPLHNHDGIWFVVSVSQMFKITQTYISLPQFVNTPAKHIWQWHRHGDNGHRRNALVPHFNSRLTCWKWFEQIRPKFFVYEKLENFYHWIDSSAVIKWQHRSISHVEVSKFVSFETLQCFKTVQLFFAVGFYLKR